ncbi:MAG: preprotein translocase subunit SecA [Actinobacteria bacterium]|nr:preprotein translocase subunit SecA [Actinomycetota bacterium]
MIKVVDKVLRFGEGKKLRRLEEAVVEVAAWDEHIAPLSDDALKAKTLEFRSRLEQGETLDDLLPEAFAVAREAARRTTGMRPFDVQVMGAVVLHQGSIAEMKTGEGKTLVATMPVYLNALAGKGVHLVTVNDYLAGRDAAWMGPVYEFLGLTVSALQNAMEAPERREAYAADVTYGTNTEFGFDYLRDNMVLRPDQQVQRGHHYCIVDEVDSILIDEARTPLIISGPGERAAKTYYDFARIARRLKPGEDEDYEVDEKKRTVAITETGLARVEKELGIDNIYEDLSGQLVNHLMQALRAEALFKRDVDYLIQDGEVKIIDEFTGRVLEGRRYSEGLHQAIEAREGVKIKEENQTLATITLQNYFRLHCEAGGVTGTAATEADEFREIYGMEVVVIPTNEPMVRDDRNDLIYKTEKAKFKAAADTIADCHQRKQPILVGTISVEKSERLSEMLKRRGVPHEVLNAKHHAKEAEIVAQAGQPGAVTIATNMAGRGTDIKLGTGVVDVGGLFVLGTERHEARRVDNQLRGRSGRQGDPGASQFVISLEDDLLRIFGGERIHRLMDRLGIDEDTPIEHSLISRSVENAQKKVEEQNFQIRKRVLEYDDVMNKQREVIYNQRQRILGGEDLREDVLSIIERILRQEVAVFTGSSRFSEEWDLGELMATMRNFFPTSLTVEAFGDPTELDAEEVADRVIEDAMGVYEEREERFGAPTMREMERWVLLRTIDAKWRDHLYEMDYLREGIGLRALAQIDPLVAYKNEGFNMFQEMMESIQTDFVRYLYHLEIVREEEPVVEVAPPRRLAYSGGGDTSLAQNFAAADAAAASAGRMTDSSAEAYEAAQQATRTVVAPRSVGARVGRNDPCPCGSGKKYKKCCGS